MIPKIIHYCWFGPKKIPNSALKCIETWKKRLPDFEIKLWNEDNFDINLYPYARDAYNHGKFAFVADVCRVHALYHEGGIYLDTDVEVLKDLSPFLAHTAFSGFETSTLDFLEGEKEVHIQMGVIGSIAYGEWISTVLLMFKSLNYEKDNFSTINSIVDQIVLEKDFKLFDEFQFIDDYLYLYPSEYFIAKDYRTGLISITKHTYCIHHYDGSWLDSNSLNLKKLKYFLVKNIDDKTLKLLVTIKRKVNQIFFN